VDVAVTGANTDVVLCVNAGSSSLKLALFAAAAGEPRELGRASVDRVTDHGRALDDALGQLAGQPAPTLASHRIVHGGAEHTAPAWIDARLIAGLEALIPLAPLHLPPSLAAIAAVTARRPGLRQVACFDTAFHARMPEVARRLPLPAALDRAGVRRYGFHGLSYEYIVSALSTLGPALPPRLVIAHLGNGASLAAVEHGRSIDTTMGLTPTGGIPMGTRTGDLDPGVVLYLARERGMAPDAIAELVEHHGGLAGVGGASDMRTLLARAPDDPAARLAVELFGYAVRKQIGAYAAALGGLDALVFTGGIGEHAPEVRALACRGLAFAGIVLDDARNRASASDIGAGACAVRVIPTDEDAVLARHAVALAAR
jgi:acetate kinase